MRALYRSALEWNSAGGDRQRVVVASASCLCANEGNDESRTVVFAEKGNPDLLRISCLGLFVLAIWGAGSVEGMAVLLADTDAKGLW